MSNLKTLVIRAGIPAACDQRTHTADPHASLRGQRPEKHSRCNRALIPARIAHPKRSITFGRIRATGDSSRHTRAPGAADAGGDVRGFVLKFSARLPR